MPELDAEETLLQADYSKDVSEVYRDITISTLQRRWPRWFLAEVVHTPQTWTDRERYSSWVPRYDLPRRTANIDEVSEVKLLSMPAAFFVQFNSGMCVLRFKDFTVATIQYRSPLLDEWSG